MPTTPVICCSSDESFSTCPAKARTPSASKATSPNTIVECPRENQKPDRDRPLAVRHELAGGVVDRGNVIGIERVPHAQRVRRQTEPDAQHLA